MFDWPRKFRLLARIAGVTLVGALCSLSALADEQNQKLFGAPKDASAVAPSSAGGLAQITLSLALVLAAVFACAWAMRKMRSLGGKGGGAIEVIAERSIGPKERVLVVKIGSQQLVLGVAQNAVSMLYVLEAGAELSTNV